MDGDYYGKVAGPTLHRTMGPKPPLVPSRVSELQQTLDRNERHPRNQHRNIQRTIHPTTKC
jgi:hypothetical protein